MKHTTEDWVIVKEHPVFKNSTLIMADLHDTGKSVKKGKLICKIIDIRGDSFTEMPDEERDANIKLIVSAPEMSHNLSEINFYAKKAIEALNDQSLAQARGLLIGIFSMSQKFK